MPDFVRREIEGLSVSQEAEYLILVYLFSPFFLIIPTLTSSVIASDSFAGEKERKTIEALLATPISDSELFLGKMLVSFIPSMIVTILCFMGYSAIVDLITFEASGRLLLPNVTWILLIFLLAPTFALASIGLTVMISVRVKGYREAQQISAVLLLPVLALLFAQMSGAVFFGPIAILSLTGVMMVMDVVIFRLGVKLFRREQILQRLA